MTLKELYACSCELVFIRDRKGKSAEYHGEAWGKNYTVGFIKVRQLPMYENVIEIHPAEKFYWNEVRG